MIDTGTEKSPDEIAFNAFLNFVNGRLFASTGPLCCFRPTPGNHEHCLHCLDPLSDHGPHGEC